jgi:hypothetical protein
VSDRINVTLKKNQLDVFIRIKQNKKALIWVLLAIIPWVFLLMGMEQLILKTNIFWQKAFLFLLLLVWMSLGAMGSIFLTWLLFGRERLMCNREHILIEKPLVIYNRRNYYDIDEISNIRIDKEQYQVSRDGEWTENERIVLAFDTPHKRVFFARGVTIDEAEKILLALASTKYIKEHQFAIRHIV